MNDFSRILLPSCRMPVLGLMLALAVARPAAAADYTDLWWNALESGWGVNFIQADNFIFATFFVYDGGSQPIWYSAEMTSDDKGVWSGPLYLTAGTYFGAPWNPSQRGINQVGSASFTPTSSVAGTLAYNVANAVVTKQVTRQALKTIPIGAGYFGGIVSERYNCQNPADNSITRVYAEITATQTAAGAIRLDFDTGHGTCSMAGNYLQDGQLYRMPAAAYTCGSSLSTTAAVADLKATNFGLEGRWNARVNGGCIEAGEFSVVLK